MVQIIRINTILKNPVRKLESPPGVQIIRINTILKNTCLYRQFFHKYK